MGMINRQEYEKHRDRLLTVTDVEPVKSVSHAEKAAKVEVNFEEGVTEVGVVFSIRFPI